MLEVTLTLSFPPNVNHYKSIGRTVRTKSGKIYQQRVNSPQTIDFYYRVWMAIRAQNAPSFGNRRLEVEIFVCPPDKRRRDLDGVLKVLLDSMERGGLYDDDEQIDRLIVIRGNIIREGQIIVRVSELSCT